MSNLTNKNLQRMRELMGKAPVNESISNSAIELVKKSPDGKAYGIVRENRKYFIKESNDGKNFDFIGGIANKPKYQYHSYEEAVRELNFMFEDLNKTFNIEKGTNILSSDIIEEKRFVIKSKKKSEPSSSDFDFGGGEEDKSADASFDFGDIGKDDSSEEELDFSDVSKGDSSEEDLDFGDIGKGDSDEDMNIGDEDLSDEDDPIKSIQKMTGKLGQKIRDTEDLSSDTMKWVAKSIISALDLEAMDTEDKKDIIRAVKKKEDEGSDEEFDFMNDEDATDILTSNDLYGGINTDFMDDDYCPGCQGSGSNDDMNNCIDCDGTGITDDTTLDWNTLSDVDKSNLVSTTYGGNEETYPGDLEKPMMDWDIDFDGNDVSQLTIDFPEDDEEAYIGNTGLNYDEPDEDFMTDWMREDNPNIGGDEDIDGQLLFDEELPYDEDDTVNEYPGFNTDWMEDDDTYPYHEVNTDYMDDREEDLYGPGTDGGIDDVDNMTDYMAKFSKDVARNEKTKGRMLDRHEIDTHVRKLQNKLGGSDMVSIDGNKVVGDFGYVEVTSMGYTLYKEGSKFGKKFNFDEIGRIKSTIGNSVDYMMDIDTVPSMMPKTAPSKPSTTPAPTTKPGKPDTDRPNPSKRPFTPPPYITPGEEPSPKAEYQDEFNDEMGYMSDDYGSNESMDYMDDDNTCPGCKGYGIVPTIGFRTKPSTCISCAGTGKIDMVDTEEDDISEPYTEPLSNYTTNTTSTNDVNPKYHYKEKFNFPFSTGGVDYMSEFDDTLPSNSKRFNPMSPKTAPSKPSTTPAPTTKPGKPDTDRPNPSKRPFTPPPYITPGEEPSPKARGDKYKMEGYGSTNKKKINETVKVTKTQLFKSLDKMNLSDEKLNNLSYMVKLIDNILDKEYDIVADNTEVLAKEYIARY